MMSKEKIVLDILAKLAEVDVATIKPETELASQLEIDSPMALQLLFELEDALDIEISDEEAAGMETVGDIMKVIGA